MAEKVPQAEMAEHRGHGKHEPVANPAGNTRNGKSRKTLKGDFGVACTASLAPKMLTF